MADSPTPRTTAQRGAVGLALRALGWPLAAASDARATADAIVILGAPIRGDGALSPQADERVRVGVGLYRSGLADVIAVVGGHCPRGFEHTPAEAEGMARNVRALGVPEAAIRVDRLSNSTVTNAARAAAILLPEGRRRVWLVTQPFHLRRARFHFRRAGFETLGWHIDESLQYQRPDLALRWIAREYAAWALALARAAAALGAKKTAPPPR
ncbi:MAG: YdcF family protein [Byssovorax sp.]